MPSRTWALLAQRTDDRALQFHLPVQSLYLHDPGRSRGRMRRSGTRFPISEPEDRAESDESVGVRIGARMGEVEAPDPGRCAAGI